MLGGKRNELYDRVLSLDTSLRRALNWRLGEPLGWVDVRVGLDVSEKRKPFALARK